MAGKKKESLEFEESDLDKLRNRLAASPALKGEKEEEIKRHSFRVPCLETDNAEVIIKGKSYPVINVGSRGLGLILPDEHSLQEGEELNTMKFRMLGQEFTLQGRVVHISMEEDNTYLCGVALTGMGEEQSAKIRALIQSRRQALFVTEKKK